jgi:hypothetical protein
MVAIEDARGDGIGSTRRVGELALIIRGADRCGSRLPDVDLYGLVDRVVKVRFRLLVPTVASGQRRVPRGRDCSFSR